MFIYFFKQAVTVLPVTIVTFVDHLLALLSWANRDFGAIKKHFPDTLTNQRLASYLKCHHKLGGLKHFVHGRKDAEKLTSIALQKSDKYTYEQI